jgi:hypothetical protein
MLENLDAPMEYLGQMGVFCQIARVPNATHFYPRTAPLLNQGGDASDVESVIAMFLRRALNLEDR